MACLEEGYQRRQQVQGHHPAAATHLINISRPVQPQQDGGTTSSHCTTVMSNGTSASNKHEAQPVRTLCKLLNTPGKVLLQHSMPIAVLELAHCVCQPIECVCVCVCASVSSSSCWCCPAASSIALCISDTDKACVLSASQHNCHTRFTCVLLLLQRGCASSPM